MSKHVGCGPRVKARARLMLEALLAFASGKLEDFDSGKLSIRWEDDSLIVRTQIRYLKELADRYKPSAKLSAVQVKEALERLKNFMGILEDNRAQTKGSPHWHFTLKLRSRNAKKNLEWFDREWEERRSERSKQATGDAPIDSSVVGEAAKARKTNDLGMEFYREFYRDDGRTNRLREAVSHFEKAIEQYPNVPEAHYNLGCIYEELLDFESALREYRKAMVDGFPPAYNNMARLLIKQEDSYAEAVRLLQRGLKLTEESDEVSTRYAFFKNLGWARLKQGFYRKAQEALRDAIALDEDRITAHCLLAQAIEAEGNEADALVEWQKCLPHAGEDRDAEGYDADEDEWIAIARQRLLDRTQAPKT